MNIKTHSDIKNSTGYVMNKGKNNFKNSQICFKNENTCQKDIISFQGNTFFKNTMGNIGKATGNIIGSGFDKIVDLGDGITRSVKRKFLGGEYSSDELLNQIKGRTSNSDIYETKIKLSETHVEKPSANISGLPTKQKLVTEQKPIIETKIEKSIIVEQPKVVFPKTEFSFDFEKLKLTLDEVDTVTPEWIEDNPEEAENILRAFKLNTKGLDSDLKDPEIQTNLINGMLKDKDAFLRRVEQISNIEKSKYLEQVAKFANHTDKELAIKGLKAIAEYGNPERVDKLGTYLSENDPELIREFVNAVGKAGDPQKHSRWITKFLRRENHNYDNETYEAIVKALKEKGSPEHVDLLIPLFDKVEKGNHYLTRSLASTIGKLGQPEHIEKLKPYLDNLDQNVRIAICTIIGKIGKPEHADLLIPGLSDESLKVRAEATKSLRNIGKPEHVDLIIPNLNVDVSTSSGEDTLAESIKTIGELGNSGHIELIKSFLNHKYNGIKKYAEDAARKLTDKA
ncbi:MAG: HEAT repeat domain-containing protein [Candidatus Gastranaerophilales bacterium]|nr:HEAT repeat domain-containing protein [Candidatus Gastranaerophilales bacterium]